MGRGVSRVAGDGGAEDFTVKAGTISQAANAKRYRVAEIALLDRVPLVMMLDGAGYRADGASTRARHDLLAQGRCRARAARDGGSRFVRRPRGVGRSDVGLHGDEQPRGDLHGRSARSARVTRESVTKEELGGPSVAVASA